MKSWTTRPMLIVALLVGALLITASYVATRKEQNTVTAYFDRAVAVYPGTDLRIMGVQVGEVTAVVPNGNSVRVEMRYDSEYQLPSNAGAAVVTPTLVADRYIQVFPPYSGGEALADGGEIPLERTETPVELDRMFKSLDDLSVALGPQAGQDGPGALAAVLDAGAEVLEGNGELGNETIQNMSAVAETLAENRGPLFDNVQALASITDTLAANDATVETFITELSGASEQLAGEREELAQVLDSLARVLTTVEDFIAENRDVLGRDLDKLDSVLTRVENQKDAIGLVTQKGALAMGNLAVAFEPGTGTFGSRVQVAPGIQFRPDTFACQTLTNAGLPEPAASTICGVLTSVLVPAAGAQSAGGQQPAADLPGLIGPSSIGSDGPPDLLGLLSGGQQ